MSGGVMGVAPAATFACVDALDSADTPIAVLHEGAGYAVVDKPAGLMAHASAMARGEDDFLVDRLRAQFGRPVHLVHRLDRATSGCLLVAFDAVTAASLGAVFMSRAVDKQYLAICRGWPDAELLLDYPLDGGPGKPEKKSAVTHFARMGIGELPLPSAAHDSSRYALLLCSPQTGRFRQIRRHLKHLSHHLIGDSSHGDGRHNRHFRMQGVHRMLLHAWRLGFDDPATGVRVRVQAPLDREFQRALSLLALQLPTAHDPAAAAAA
jgi:tRNA pseudouridine65 synthase